MVDIFLIVFRWSFSIVLLVCVWKGSPWWAIPLAVTLSAISQECYSLVRQAEAMRLKKLMKECVPGESIRLSIADALATEIKCGAGNALLNALKDRI